MLTLHSLQRTIHIHITSYAQRSCKFITIFFKSLTSTQVTCQVTRQVKSSVISGGSSSQHVGGALAPMVSALVWAYNEGLGAEPSMGWDSGQGVSRAKLPWSWHTFGFWAFNGSCKFAHFSTISKPKEMRYLCHLCQKSCMAMKRGAGAKLGGCAPPPDRA